MYNKVAVMNFTSDKDGIPFARGVFISGSRDHIDYSLGDLKLAPSLIDYVHTANKPGFLNNIVAATIAKRRK
jgi:hypothetical protein